MKTLAVAAIIFAASTPAWAGGGGATVPVEGLRDTILYALRFVFGH